MPLQAQLLINDCFFLFELLNIRSIQKRLCNSWFLHNSSGDQPAIPPRPRAAWLNFWWGPRGLAVHNWVDPTAGQLLPRSVWGIQVASRLIVTGIAPLKHHPISTAYIQKKQKPFFLFGRKLGFQWRARAAFRVFFQEWVDFSVAPEAAKQNQLEEEKLGKNSEV